MYGIVYFFYWWGKYCVDSTKTKPGFVPYFKATGLPLIVSSTLYLFFSQDVSSPYRKDEIDTLLGPFTATKYGGYAYGLTAFLVFLIPSLVGVYYEKKWQRGITSQELAEMIVSLETPDKIARFARAVPSGPFTAEDLQGMGIQYRNAFKIAQNIAPPVSEKDETGEPKDSGNSNQPEDTYVPGGKPDAARDQQLVSAFGEVIERHSHEGLLISEDLLPASKDEIKEAMVRTAKRLKSQGEFDKKTRDAFEVCFTKLADFVPASEAGKSQRLTKPLEEQAGNFSAEEFAEKFLELDISSEAMFHLGESRKLVEEFRAALDQE